MTNLTWQDYRNLLIILLTGPAIGLPLGILGGFVIYIFFLLIPGIYYDYKIIILFTLMSESIGIFISLKYFFRELSYLYYLRNDSSKID